MFSVFFRSGCVRHATHTPTQTHTHTHTLYQPHLEKKTNPIGTNDDDDDGNAVPADGVKGKTWGPSTLHQRERGAIISPSSSALPSLIPAGVVGGGAGGADAAKRWSRSAPDLEKTPLRAALLVAAAASAGNPGSHHHPHQMHPHPHHHHQQQQQQQHHHQRSPLLQEIGNVRKASGESARKLYSSANDLLDGPEPSATTPTGGVCLEFVTNDHDEGDDSSSSGFVVGCVRKTKRRERSKSKDSAPASRVNNQVSAATVASGKRRDSSESRLTYLADFFRSPSGSRKSSLANNNGERKNSAGVTIRINDSDGLESSPENSMTQHKSRASKSPLRVLSRVKAWGSRDALDDKTSSAGSAKVEYSVLQDSITLPRFERQLSTRTTPSFLAANSREGIDFENLESELRNLESEQSILQELELASKGSNSSDRTLNNFSDTEPGYGSDDDTEDLIENDRSARKNEEDKSRADGARIIRESGSANINHHSTIGSFAKPKIHVAKKFFRKNYGGTLKKN